MIDSHCRNERGEISDTGASILMTFSTVENFVQYMIGTYIQQISLKAYQLQFVKCICTLTSGQCHYVSKKHVSLEQKKAQKAQDKKRVHLAYTKRKDEILKKRKLEYSVIDHEKNRALLNKAKEKYKGMDDIAKISLLDKKKRVHNVQKGKKKVASNKRHNSLETCLSTFNRKIREGPFYTCTVCNRLLYKRTVKRFVQVNTHHCQNYLLVSSPTMEMNTFVSPVTRM